MSHSVGSDAATTFGDRHIGPRPDQIVHMLQSLGLKSLDELVAQTVPEDIRRNAPLALPAALSEREAIQLLSQRAGQNQVYRSFIGMGYYDTITPPVILRNILENPGWYTAYTPYQAEISQGRMEALLLFQTMIQDLTGLDVAGASLLDEGTAAAEAMAMMHRLTKGKVDRFFVSERCHPQTIAVVKTRAEPMGISLIIGDESRFDFGERVFGFLLQSPTTDGSLLDLTAFCKKAHDHAALVTVITDLLALTLTTSPGEQGADIAVGNSQRFGVPMGFGGPHAAFLACRGDFKRDMPGRLIGISKDSDGNPALRMALQTREQHIRRQKATSNICTAQVLLAVCAAMYAVWHGPEGLLVIAKRVNELTNRLVAGLRASGVGVRNDTWFDTIKVANQTGLKVRAEQARFNLREFDDGDVGISLDETTTPAEVEQLLVMFGASAVQETVRGIPDSIARTSSFLTHAAFNTYRSEHQMLRYLHKLESKDLALNASMIPLGSCTMKLNATSEMIPVTWAGFGGIHPFAPREQWQGYATLFAELESWIGEITGFDAVSLQPNAGSQGEYAGLLTIRAWHRANGSVNRDVCLIPASAHGTNPATAAMAGLEVVPVECDTSGNVNVEDLKRKAERYADRISCLMITYPSTHGVFEAAIREICEIVHGVGGQVYMDGANLNAQVGLCRPADIGADVCHLNLHKTFCIPHGGGGPGMGPIGVRKHLAAFLPGHPIVPVGGNQGPVSSAPYGSSSILPISWAYIAMCGPDGLKKATEVAILNANYLAERLKAHFPVLYTGANGRVAHECILDLRALKDSSGISVDDVAKRLMDYGFHAPTMSFPVAGTLMIEPTESEDLGEMERFIEAMIAIRKEIADVEEGRSDAEDNALKHSPHTAESVISDTWTHKYTREQAAYPVAGLRRFKYWPTVRRVDNVFGDRNVVCSCIVDWPPAS